MRSEITYLLPLEAEQRRRAARTAAAAAAAVWRKEKARSLA